jgi:hypothetical protein
MTEYRSRTVFRRSVMRDGRSIEREFIWTTGAEGSLAVYRGLVDAYTGEVLDEVWLTRSGQVRARSAPRREASELSAPDGDEAVFVETVVAASPGSHDDVVEDGRGDRALSGQR